MLFRSNKEYLTGITEKVEKHKSTDKNIDTNIDTDLNADTNRNQTLSAKKKQFDDQYGLRDEIIFQILKETEIRISELAELNIQDFDLRNQRFYVYRTKQRSTWITMSEALTDLIKRYLEERSAYLFEKDAEAMFLVTIGRYKEIGRASCRERV